MKSTIPQLLTYDYTAVKKCRCINFLSLTSDFAGSRLYGVRLSGFPLPMKQMKSIIPQLLMFNIAAVKKCRCMTGAFVGTRLYGSRLSGGPPP